MTVTASIAYQPIGYTTFPERVGDWVWAPAVGVLLQLDPDTLAVVACHGPAASVPIQTGDRLWAPCPDATFLREVTH